MKKRWLSSLVFLFLGHKLKTSLILTFSLYLHYSQYRLDLSNVSGCLSIFEMQTPQLFFHERGIYSFFCSGLSLRSVAQSCQTLCNSMTCSTPGLPVHHQLPEFTQTHGHRVSDAIQPPHPLSSPSPPHLNLFHHQGLF